MTNMNENSNNSIVKVALNLTVACLISGVIIGLTYYFTSPIAKEKNVMLKTQAMQALVKDAQAFKPVEGKAGWYEAVKGGKAIAYVVPSESRGYGGSIKMLVAITPDGTVLNYDILSHNETPGLGDNATKEKFKNQFQGMSENNLVVVKDPSDIQHVQAITGATITSKAVTKGVKEAGQVVKFSGGE